MNSVLKEKSRLWFSVTSCKGHNTRYSHTHAKWQISWLWNSTFLWRLNCYSFNEMREKLVKAVFRHLSANTPAPDIVEALQEIVFVVLVCGQMIAKRPLPSAATDTINLPLLQTRPKRYVISNPMQRLCKGRELQSLEQLYVRFQLPAVCPHLGAVNLHCTLFSVVPDKSCRPQQFLVIWAPTPLSCICFFLSKEKLSTITPSALTCAVWSVFVPPETVEDQTAWSIKFWLHYCY